VIDMDAFKVKRNIPQMIVQMVNATIMWILWGRGTGKTVGPLAWFLADRAEKMPGHTGGIFGKSFEDLEKKIMPKLVKGLADLGYQDGVDYVYDKKPPAHFGKPITPAVTYKQHLFWHNGTVFALVSLFQKGSANAYDFQSGIFDEIKLMSPIQLEDEIFPTFRGSELHKERFGHMCEYLSQIFATDKMEDPLLIEWILKKREQVEPDRVEQILSLQDLLNEEYIKYYSATDKQKPPIEKSIAELEFYLNRYRKNAVYVSEASALDNIHVLGEDWLRNKERNMSKYVFDVAILNKDPEAVTEGFYPDLDKDVHEYEMDNDYDPNQPLIISSDYQHSVSPIPIAQLSVLPGNKKKTLNFIDEVFTLSPEGLEAAVSKFCERYKDHKKKVVYYTTDMNACAQRQSAESFNVIVKNILKEYKWTVHEVYTGAPTRHFWRYTRMKFFLGNAVGTPYEIRFNSKKCPFLLFALKNAKTKTNSKGETEKEKKYENTNRYPEANQAQTTHFTDAYDTMVEAVCEKKKINFSGSTGGGAGFR
jgi:hypothetical protein